MKVVCLNENHRIINWHSRQEPIGRYQSLSIEIRGRVVFITEDVDPILDSIPNKISAKILLPPFEATELELDGRINESSAIYFI